MRCKTIIEVAKHFHNKCFASCNFISKEWTSRKTSIKVHKIHRFRSSHPLLPWKCHNNVSVCSILTDYFRGWSNSYWRVGGGVQPAKDQPDNWSALQCHLSFWSPVTSKCFTTDDLIVGNMRINEITFD